MASYAAVLSLMNTLNLINKHPSPPISLHQCQVDSLTLSLTFFQEFLERHSSSGEEDDVLESCIAAAAYAAEDAIESHIVDQIHGGSNISTVDLSQRLERVIQDMNLIKNEVMEIKEVKSMKAQHYDQLYTYPSVSASAWQNSTMVDYDEDLLNDVLDKLIGQHDLQTISIVGMGGIVAEHYVVDGVPQQYLVQNLNLPHSLKKLTLSGTMLSWGKFSTNIGSLPFLEYLKLDQCACYGAEWETVEGQFCNLKVLLLEFVDLRYWRTEDTHFPRLEHLVLQHIYELEEIPSSIGDIPTLELIEVAYCSTRATDSANRIQAEQLELGNEDLQVIISCFEEAQAYPKEEEDD